MTDSPNRSYPLRAPLDMEWDDEPVPGTDPPVHGWKATLECGHVLRNLRWAAAGIRVRDDGEPGVTYGNRIRCTDCPPIDSNQPGGISTPNVVLRERSSSAAPSGNKPSG